jgi:hypothetical protein
MGDVTQLSPNNFPLLGPEEYSDELCKCGSGLRKSKELRHNNTSYHIEALNWLPPCCDQCYIKEHNYYAEKWAEYYRGCL